MAEESAVITNATRAQIARELLRKRKIVLQNLSPSNRQELYYKVYTRIDKDSVEKRQPTMIQPGIDKVVYYNTPLQITRVGTTRVFDVTLGELIRRIHLACEEEIDNTLIKSLV